MKKFFLFLTLLTLSVGQMWGAEGDVLKTYDTNSSTFTTGYKRQSGDNFVWWGQKNYLGANNATNHGNLKPTAADLPVVKAQNASATTSTTGLYYCYTSEAVANVGAIEIYLSAKSGSSTVNAYIVTSSTAALSGSATWTKVTLSASSAKAQGANVASAVTYRFTFNATETGAKYYGVVFATSSYWRATGFQMKLIEGATSSKTLSSVAVSGTPTKTAYENGDAFEASGLTVTGTYSDSSNKTETTGITWTACKTQDGTYVALDNAAALLATGETDIYVKATVSGKTSPAFHVTGLTVTAPLPTITITQSQVTSFTNTYAEYSWTAGGVSGKMYAYKNSGMQFNSGKDGYYVYNTDPIPGVIRKITMTQASGTARTWTPYVSTTALTSATGTALTAQSVTTSGTTWDVTGSNSYFYLTVAGGSTVIGSIVITYEEVKNAVTVATPATGSGTLTVTGAASLSEVLLGTELTVSAAPSATYHGGTVKVIKTGVTPEADVTSTVYNAGTGKLTMPDYPITVSATFVADAAISVAIAAGQSSWGSVKLYNSTPAEVSSGTTFKPNAEFMIEAIPASSDYEFVSWAKSAGSDITLSDADAIDNDPTLTAGEVSTTFTATFREAAKPYLTIDPESLTFGPIAVNGSQNKTFKLTGQNLTEGASLAITGTGAAMFSVAASVAKDGDGAIDEDVTVTYNPTAAGTHTATLTVSSDGAVSREVALSGEAKVLRTVKWYSSNSTEITGDDLGEATTSVLDGGKVTTLPDAPESCDASISFQGWTNATYAKSDDAPTVLFTDAEDAPAVSGGNASYYAVWANTGAKSDELTRATTGVTNGSTSYDNWSGKTVNSTAVYAGNSAGSNDAIQLRSNNSNSGVITTTSGGKALKVSVVWESHTQNGRTLNVYGKNSTYSAPTDLFDAEERGTLIGTIVYGTSTELTIPGDYAYIGVCSADGALYLTSLTVQWSKVSDYATTCSAPVVIADPTFSPAAGTYDNDQSVTLGFASPATAVYYTTDGTSDPKTVGTLYSSPIAVTVDMTIKAAATDGNGNWSNVVTKTYTINYSPSIAAYIAKAQASTRALKLNAAQNCIVTAVKKNYQDKVTNIYCQDNSGAGIIIYNGAGFGDNEINVGDRIVGAVSGTWSPYLMQPEMGSAVFADGTTFTAVSRPAAPTVTVAEVNSGDAYTAHPMMLVTVADLYYKSVSGSAYTFNTQANGEGTDITIYDNFSYLSGKTMPGVACTIVGIMARNNNAYQVLPLELTTAEAAALPEIDPEGGADAENAVEVIYLSEISVGSVADEDITITLNDVEKTDDNPILVQGDLKLEVSAKRDFYADNSVTYYYKPSAYPKNISVTSEHGTIVVKVGDNVVETALPGATVNFTVTPENEHFHIASTSVTYEGGSLTPSLSENVYSFTMPDKDATIVVNYTEDTKYSITFNGGGAAGEGPAAIEDQYAGAEITLPTKEEANYTAPTDKVFNGWLVTSGEDVVEQSAGMFVMPAGNVTITAQWASKVYCALTLSINGATTTTNIDREVKYILPIEEDPISGYDFYGWAEAPEVDDVEDAIDTIKAFTPAADEASKTLYAVFKRTETGAQKTDVLTHEDFNATETSYVEFSDVQKNSNAKYAGKTALNGTANIQINKKAENGIYSSVSGGTLVSVTIAMTSNAKKLGVYGSNTAYTSYVSIPSQTGSTKIESFANVTSKTVTPESDYKYVGIASDEDGAKYIQSITIVWQPKATYYTTAPAQVYDVEYALGGGAWKENEGCEAAKVKAGQTYTICADEPVRDHYTFAKWQIGGEDASGEITINANTTITAVWTPKAQSNVTYNAGTGSGDPVVVSNVEEGTEVTLKAIGSGEGEANFTKSGYDFVGWLINGVLRKAGETFEMPAEAVTLTAQWKKQNVEKLTLVKDASQLLDGMKVVLANQEAEVVAGASSAESDTYLAYVTEGVTFNEEKTQLTAIGAGIHLTLEKVASGWALKYNGKYLDKHSSNKVKWVANPVAWTISFSGNDAIIETAEENGSALRCNSNTGSERFSAYSNKTSCNPLQLYGELTVVSADVNVSDLGYVDGDVIVLSENATLTIDADIAPTTMIVPAGGTVTVNDSKTVDANTLIVERGGMLDIQENGTVNTNETFVIYSTLGKGTGTETSGNKKGSSSQIKHANKLNAAGDVFIEIELTQDAAASEGWYAFSVPFPVDAMSGVYYGSTQLENEVGYAIMSYHGDLRAQGQYAWKKYRDIMEPGVLYIITVGDTDYKTLRFKKHGNDAFNVNPNVSVKSYPVAGDVPTTNRGWNGIGNPNLQISYLPQTTNVAYMQFLIHDENRFQVRTRSNINIVVGSAFFIQYSGNSDATIEITPGLQDGANGYLAPKREHSAVEETIYEVELTNVATGELNDNIYLTAREEALNEYEVGRDLAKMSMGNAKCAQMWIPAYGTQLCAADFQLVNNQAEYPLTINAPKAGTYTISTVANENADIYLTQNGTIIWNLSMGEYTMDLNKGTTNGYGLLLKAKAPNAATGVDNVQGDNVQCTKVVIDDHVYILRGGEMYDVTGKMVK